MKNKKTEFMLHFKRQLLTRSRNRPSISCRDIVKQKMFDLFKIFQNEAKFSKVFAENRCVLFLAQIREALN